VFGKTLSGRNLSPEAIKAEPSSYELAMLGAMQHMHLYQGTVASNIKTARRARGKVAKASRKGNR
jgi:hypothetical protein